MTKRLLSLLLALTMIFSVVPVQVFAVEGDPLSAAVNEETQFSDVNTDYVEAEPVFEENETAVPVYSEQAMQIQNEIDAIVAQYGVSAYMTDNEIASQIFVADGNTLYATMNQIDDLESRAAYLSEAELASLNTDTISRFINVLDMLMNPALMATTQTVLDGKISLTDSGSNGSLSGSTYKATAKGSLISKKDNTITITNETSELATISFDYAVSNQNSFTINGASAATSGSFSAVMEPGATVKFYIQSKSGFSAGTVTLTLSNFSHVAAAAQSSVTIEFDSSLGSVTTAGNAVASGDVLTVSLDTGVELVATANGSQFLGWINTADNSIVSSTAAFTLKTGSDMTIKPVFAQDGGKPWFSVGGKSQKSVSVGLLGMSKLYYYEVGASKLFDDLNAAAQYAASEASNKSLVLRNNAVLPAGNYTIPANVDLLIPFDAANTMYTTQAVGVELKTAEFVEPTPYRSLTMSSGANLTVNGSVSLSAKHRYAQGSTVGGGSPYGPVGFIQMNDGSSIVVNNGGALYVYGYICGSGSITANSGASVYENFQIMDFRGGTQSTDMKNGVFPTSQYYIQNIEVPLTLYAGAKEYSYTTIYMQSSAMGSSVDFIGPSNAMFNLTSGYVTKRYDGTTDRLIVEANGDLAVSPISIDMGLSSINSKNYELPINSNLTVRVNTGNITMSQDVALLPGARIEVGEAAKIILSSGVNVYVYDADEWSTYAGAVNQPVIPVTYAPGRTYTRTEADLVDAAIIIDGVCDGANGYVYTTAGGANISTNGTGIANIRPGTQTVTYQMIQSADGATYVEIPLTSAKMMNADGSYVGTDYTAGTYTYANGAWVKDCVHEYTEEIITAATCEAAGLKKLTCKDTVVCCHSYTEAIPATGHTEVVDAAVAPTCTGTGLTEGKHCSVCSKVLVAQEEVAALGHTEAPGGDAVAPTCTAEGWTESTVCSVCGATIVPRASIAALGHTAGAYATCTTNQTCTVCGDELTAALGHTAGADATCTDAQSCTVCGEVLTSALGHTEVGGGDYVAATCTAEGWTESTVCSVCGETLVARAAIPALGHTEVGGGDYVAPTCSSEGWTESKVCTACGVTTVAREAIAKLSHTLGENANCTDAQTCTVCGEELEAALGHSYDATVTAPTCTEAGFTTHTCGRCGDTYQDEEKAALGHTEVIDAAVAATCTETGLTEGKHCSVCGEVLVAQETVAALGHTEVVDAAVAATCTETGLTEGKHCSVCGEVLVAQETVAALGHTEVVDAAVAPTCTATGKTEGKHCSVCDEVLVAQEVVDALGHTEVIDAAYEATCSLEGKTEGKHCVVCGEILVAQEVIEKLPHTEEEFDQMPALCGTPGHEAGAKCSVCGEVVRGMEEIPALEHEIEQVAAKKPTYTSVGWEDYEHCTRPLCDYTTYVEISKLDEPEIDNYDDFITNLALLEEMAYAYTRENPGKDPLNLVIKYIRTGVARYNSGSWGIMAGYEDAAFAAYVAKMEDEINSEIAAADDPEIEMIMVSGLKNLHNFTLSNGEYVDFGHMFGTMDITYHNNFSVNHADVGGWTGDIVDLLSLTDQFGLGEDVDTMEEMVTYIGENYFLKTDAFIIENFGAKPSEGSFSEQDMTGDLDGLYIMDQLKAGRYENGMLTAIIADYFTEELDMVSRAKYFLDSRLDGETLRANVRNAVYNAYTGNKVVSTLENTREFNSDNLDELRKACCYAFADYICKLAGDYVEVIENPYYTVFSSKYETLAPGISQESKVATTADGKQLVYYVATGDLTRDDVEVYANYNNNDPGAGWAMQRVLDQANAAQAKYGDPESEYYIENYNVIVSTNGDGYNMSTGQPGGLLVMNGTEYHPVDANGFFGILKDGTPVIGTTTEYKTIYKDQVRDAIGGFGTTLIKDGKIAVTASSSYYTNRAPRTAVGITSTGKVVMMTADGRQEPYSCGASMEEIAQIMFEAGCVHAINLDGGGSTTFVAKKPGEDQLSVVNSPSDGAARSVATSLLMVSTAPSSTKFDHAILETDVDYMTVGASVQITPVGVSATGNGVDIPEGTVWSVSDSRWGSITEDGLFTADRVGSVTIELLLDGEVIGSKVLNIVTPDSLYFTRDSINAVYGQSVQLPVKALFEGKEVAILASDLVFTLSNAAGTVEGFFFTAAEATTLKSVKVTAALANDEAATATIVISLYNQGEVSFDFDQATGGDRQMAWDRQVSNATTVDHKTYEVVNTNEAMVTSYTFAIDMTQIPIPVQLTDLIYMLPGADTSNASAWNFLLQLAERISVLSHVDPSITFDPRFDVDISDLKLINDYFELAGTTIDEATNTITLRMQWIDQTKAIDPETANPLCIVSGIKLTPKADAEWDGKGRIAVVNYGNVSYEIYMRASGLYSFACKADNQEIFGVYPFINPNDSSEKGGYFSSVYATFEDSYTLVNVVKEGWINEDGGFAYYVAGERLYGVHKIDGLYYNFDDNGINVGKTPYSGLFVEDGLTYYAILGEVQTGWNSIDGVWYLFDWTKGFGRDGIYNTTMSGIRVTYELDNGRLLKGFWYEDENGRQYFEGPYHIERGWYVIEGERYFFKNFYACTGVYPVFQSHDVVATWYEFDETGIMIGLAQDGLYWHEGELHYVTGANSKRLGVYIIDGDYYCFNSKSVAVRNNRKYWISNTNDLIPAGTYRIGEDGKIDMSTGFENENGTLYYHENGKRTGDAGLILLDGEYYHVGSGAIVTVNKSIWVSKTNGLVEAGTYRFDAEGKMIRTTEIVEEDGVLYYYKDGKKTSGAGLVELNGAYYHIDGKAKAETNVTIWVTNTNGLWPVGSYTFGADGKMVIYDGIANGYYYVEGIKTAAGLIYVDGSYYYAEGGGKLVVGKNYWVSNTNDLLPAGTYRFDADGKINMATELVNENGTLYYFENGKKTADAGILLIDGSYYYIASGAIAVAEKAVWVSKTNGLFEEGTYRFDAEGKMILKTEIVEENGSLYYYKDGKKTSGAGLVELDGAYYHIDGKAKAETNVTIWVSNTNGLWPAGSYTFGADGKMIIYDGIANGFYYVEGIKTAAGLIYVDGSYYYAEGGGKLVVGKNYWISNTNDLLPAGTYRFDADGKINMATELVNENGTLYYFKNGKKTADAGILLIDGSYYYIASGAIAAADKAVWVSNTNGLFEEGTYRFDAEGKMILKTEIVEENGSLYYYRNGKKTSGAGLVELDGAYYHIDGKAKVETNVTIWVSNTNGLWPAGSYTFGADGKMIIYDGIANGFYYVEGIKTAAGLIYVDGSYYYAEGGGKLVVSKSYWISKTNDLLKEGTYRFNAEGKIIMTTELVNENGTLYYYENGIRTANAGVLLIDGNYYYVSSGAIAVADKAVWVSNTNGLFEEGTYRFDAEGKMILKTEIVEENGSLYYYKDGKKTSGAGLIELDGAYYHIDGKAKAETNVTIWVSNTNGLWPAGSYTFGADGKMIIYNGVANGFYYVEGVKTAAGLVYEDGYYYYAEGGGKLAVSKSCWISNTNGLLAEGTYRFDVEGKIIMTTELVEEGGVLYYYKDGKRTANAGLIEIDGDYYYIASGAKAVVGQRCWVSNTNGLMPEGGYEFGADGKMIK